MSDLPENRTRTALPVRGRFRRPSLRPVNKLVLGANKPSGVDSGIGQGMEMALTIAVFFGLGWLIDSWVESRPIFTIAFVIFAAIGQSVRMWLAYDARMKVLEEERRRHVGRRLVGGEAADETQ